MAGTNAARPGAAQAGGMPMQPFYFRVQGRALFGAVHRAASPRALLVMCPPLLHEHVRSYRFFSHLADRFAASGVSCLRFDYFGTGDSEGADEAFAPRTALADIAGAADELRARCGDLPLVLMGIRGSALLAAMAVEQARADALWLWQPEDDGTHYLARLMDQDLCARSDPNRYPARPLPRAAQADELLGFRVHEDLLGFLRSASLRNLPSGLPMETVVMADAPEPAAPHGGRHQLAASAGDWAWEIDFPRVIHARDAASVVDALLTRLPRATAPRSATPRQVAHG